jgi:iron complex outermembrane receptor protein
MSCRRWYARAFVVEASTVALILTSGAAPSLAESVQIEQVTVEGSKPKPPPRRQSSTATPKRAVTSGVAAPAATPAPPASAPSETAWGPVQGYVATRSATGTKTDTPLIETPQSISVITSDQMQAQGVQNLAQALRYTPGVTGELFGIDQRGYGLQIRGFRDDSDSIFYKDGLSLKGTAFTTFLPLDPYGAERIEVVRGPASVLYGQGEPSGIINYVTKRPLDKPFREVEFGAGNFNHYDGKFDFSGPVNQEKTLLYRLTGLVRDSDTQVDFVGQKRVFIAPALTWKPDADTTLTILSHYQRDKNGWAIQFLPAQGTALFNPNGHIPSNRFIGEPSFDSYEPTQYSIGYLFEHRANDVWTLRQNARYAGLDNPNQPIVYGAGFTKDPQNQPIDLRTLNRFGDFGRSKLDTFTIDNQAQAKFATGPLAHTLLLGLDHQRYKITDFGMSLDALPIDVFNPVYGQPIVPGAPYQDTDQRQAQTGLYLQDQIKFGGWVLSLGGRQDWAGTHTVDPVLATNSTQNDKAFTYRAGLLYHFDNGVAPYVSYATSFLPVLSTDFFGQPFLPQTGKQYEVGVKYQPPGWRAFVTVAAFDLTRQNVLTTDPDPTHQFSQVQTGEIRSRGLEVEAVASLSSELNLRAAYTYLDTKITADNDGNVGKTPYGVPRHSFAFWADYTIRGGTFNGLGFGAGVRYIGETFGTDANTYTIGDNTYPFILPSVTLADAAIHYDWGQFRFAVNAKNIFDREYVASCFNFDFGCVYGERRRVIGSVRYRW